MPSHEVTEDLFDSVVNLNFKGPFRLASQVAKRMYDGEGGAIINVSSGGRPHAPAQRGPLRQRQGGAQRHDRLASRAEYGPKVRVNTLSPGPFLTDISKAWTPKPASTPTTPSAARACPRRSSPPPSSSPARLRSTTGAIVRVDGGLKIGQ